MKSTKKLSLLLALLLFAGMLTGCGTPTNSVSNEPSASPSAVQSAAPSVEVPGVVFPLSEPAEFSMWTTMYNTNLNIYATLSDHPVVKELERLTNVSITFVHPANGSEAESFNLMLASQEYNDVINTAHSADSATTLNQNGVIIDLTDLISKYMPNYNTLLTSDPAVAKDTKDDNSKNLLMYQIYDLVPLSWGGLAVRKDLLDKAGLGIPETYDDWEKAGLAFKDMGIEVPIFMPSNGSFTYWSTFESGFGIGSRFYSDGDAVKYGPMEPGYKNYVAKMASWYKQGLFGLDFTGGSGFFNMLGTPDFAEFYSGKVGGCVVTSSLLATLPVDTKQTAISDMYVASAYTPVQNKGDKVNYSTAQGSGRVSAGFAITTAVSEEKMQMIMAYFDYLYGSEGSILANFGVEGDSLMYDAAGKPHYTDIINTSAVDGVNYFHVYDKALFAFPFFVYDKERLLSRSDEILKLQEKWVVTGTDLAALPTLSLSADETTRASSIVNDANTYVNEMTVKFIIGEESLDNYNTMIDTLNSMDIAEAIAINQAGLDRYNAR